MVFLFILCVLLVLLCLWFLWTRFQKFRFLRKACGDDLRKIRLAALAPVLLFAVFLCFDTVNSAVVLFVLTLIWLLCCAAGKLLNRLFHLSSDRYFAGTAALILTAVYFSAGLYNAYHVRQTGYNVETGKPIGSITVAQISDAHVGVLFDGDGFAEYCSEIAAQDPDLVVVTGDFIDDSTSKEDMIAACAGFSRLSPRLGIFYSPGNHDRSYRNRRDYSYEDFLSELRKNNVAVLEDETAFLSPHLLLAGRKDRSDSGRADIRDLLPPPDDSVFTLVLDHQPSDYENESLAGADLVLSGHTHGGQLFPVLHAGEWIGVNDATYGHEIRSGTHFIVSSGIGDWRLYFKTGCVSEYVMIHIIGSDPAEEMIP